MYYQRYKDLVGQTSTTRPYGFWTLTSASYQNLRGADSYGAEVEVTQKHKNGLISAWYSHNELVLDESSQDIRAGEPANNKLGVRERLFLSDDWTLNANYLYVEDQFTSGKRHTPESCQFDVTVAKSINQGAGELMFGVSDLFNKVNRTSSSAHETPGRTFFARLQLHF